MQQTMERLDQLGIAPAEVLLPKADPEKFAVVACDQFTSQPEYWAEAEQIVGDVPSALRLMMPEAWLEDPSKKAHEAAIPAYMEKYLKDGVFRDLGECFIYVERSTMTGVRRGLIANLALDRYEYVPGNKALIRATEKTVEERLPVRIEIRKKAAFEMPHVMVLVSDPKDRLMAAAKELCVGIAPEYDFDLMLGGGHIKGWAIRGDEAFKRIADCLEELKAQAEDGMLYAVGDGNHSLAAAKKCGDRYAMVELVNLYDEALVFEPIHRLKKDGVVVDYIHGKEECLALGSREGYEAVIMPEYPKSRLFPDVIEKGTLPKKTFSMGRAKDKRYYLECQRRK